MFSLRQKLFLSITLVLLIGFILYQLEPSINILFISAIGLGIIALLVDRWINVPIKKVANFARKIKDGNFETRIEISSKDEIGELAETMNELATTLESDISNMKKTDNWKHPITKEIISSLIENLSTKDRKSILKIKKN